MGWWVARGGWVGRSVPPGGGWIFSGAKGRAVGQTRRDGAFHLGIPTQEPWSQRWMTLASSVNLTGFDR